jgi:hypothetical protein
MGGDRLCVRIATDGNAAGVDTGLRSARTEPVGGGAEKAPDGQRTDPGLAAGAIARARSRALVDPARDVVAPADSDTRGDCGRRTKPDGWRWTPWRCAASGWPGTLYGWLMVGLRHDVGAGAGNVGARAGGNTGGIEGYGGNPALCIAGSGQRQWGRVHKPTRHALAPKALPPRVYDSKPALQE